MFQHLVESLHRRVEDVIAGGEHLHVSAHDFGMRFSTSRCLHTFGHVVYHLLNSYDRRHTQFTELLGKINIMVKVNGGSCYTIKMFHKVQALREEQTRILKERKEKIKREKELRQKQEAEIAKLKETIQKEVK